MKRKLTLTSLSISSVYTTLRMTQLRRGGDISRMPNLCLPKYILYSEQQTGAYTVDKRYALKTTWKSPWNTLITNLLRGITTLGPTSLTLGNLKESHYLWATLHRDSQNQPDSVKN